MKTSRRSQRRGIETAAAKRKVSAAQKKARAAKASKRAKRIDKLAKINSTEAKLGTTGTDKAQEYGHIAQGAAEDFV